MKLLFPLWFRLGRSALSATVDTLLLRHVDPSHLPFLPELQFDLSQPQEQCGEQSTHCSIQFDLLGDHDDFYRRLRKKVMGWLESESGRQSKWREYIVLAPDIFYFLCRLMTDKDVPAEDRAKIGTVIAYFILPIDLLPEAFLGVFGYADDVVLAAYVLNKITNSVAPEIIKKHWPGDGDILEQIRHIIKIADDMIGNGLWSKIKKRF